MVFFFLDASPDCLARSMNWPRWQARIFFPKTLFPTSKMKVDVGHLDYCVLSMLKNSCRKSFQNGTTTKSTNASAPVTRLWSVIGQVIIAYIAMPAHRKCMIVWV